MEEIKYDRHEEEWEKCLNDKERKKVAKSWLELGTLDRWRHDRMLKKILPFIDIESEWLTVGDGRYGTEANFIINHGGKAHATDISDKLLKIGHDKGFIKDFSQQNAENLNFENLSIIVCLKYFLQTYYQFSLKNLDNCYQLCRWQ